jgi:hypothetical protein
VDAFVNVNGNLEVNLSKDVHGLSIDFDELTCGIQQVKNSSTIT